MSAVTAVIIFLIGSGLLVLGAFFLWRIIGVGSRCGTLVASGMPCLGMLMWLVIQGEVELIVNLVWGVVAVNLVLGGVFAFGRRVRLTGKTGPLVGLWLLFALGACFMAGHQGGMGRFGGLGLLLAGLVMVLQFGGQNQSQQSRRLGKLWWVVVMTVVLIMLGAWLMTKRVHIVSTLVGLPTGIFGQVVVAPLVSVGALVGLCQKDKQQAEQVLTDLMWGNAILVMVVFGILALCTGGLHFGQSLLRVTLPYMIGMTIVVTMCSCLPQKTAR